MRLADLPELAAGLGVHPTEAPVGLVAGFVHPGGRRGALVVWWPAGDHDPTPDAELVGLAAELVSAGWARRHLEQELRDSERRLIEAQELAHMGSYDWNIVTDVNVWSDELFRIYGFEPQSFNASYDRFLSLLHPDDRDKIMAVHQRAYQTLEPYEMEERIVHPDGTERLLASTGEVIADELGRPVRMRGVCIDVTDRRRVEAEIQRLDQAEDSRQHALELNDNVLQGLTAAVWLLENDPAMAESAVIEVTRRTLESARSMISRLLGVGEVRPGDLQRTAPPERLIPEDPPIPAATGPGDLTDQPARIVVADDSDDLRLLLRHPAHRPRRLRDRRQRHHRARGHRAGGPTPAPTPCCSTWPCRAAMG